jgi:hypothetical protein
MNTKSTPLAWIGIHVSEGSLLEIVCYRTYFFAHLQNDNPGDNIGEERINNFFSRALAESQR